MSQYIAESSTSLHSLVTQALVDTQKYYCPFLERGYCREPSRCNFSHDGHLSTKIPTDYCHFYLANQCLYGQDCKFLHTEPEIGATNEFLENPIEVPLSTVESAYIIETGRASFPNNHDELYLESNGDEHEVYTGVDGTYDSSDMRDHRPLAAPYRLAKQSNGPEGFLYNSNNNNNSTDSDEHNQTSSCHDTNADTSQQHDSTPATTSRLKARVSQRCAMVAPSSSSASSSSSLATATLIAKLHHISPHSPSVATATTATNAAQISIEEGISHLKSNSTTITAATVAATSSASTSCSTAAKGAWQNTRLIASIRNNLIESSGNSTTGCSSRAGGTEGNSSNTTKGDLPLCPYSLTSGECPFPEGHCSYLHGMVCDLCYSACLHPFNEKQRHQHREECLREHEREMELSFAVQRSKDKVCGICMDTIVEKKPITSSRFGILEKCNHIFCLDCIRKWRGTKTFDSRTIRACPECRVSSDFVVPSKYWVEDQDDKDKLITDYKSALRAKPCRYFKEGNGECPFAGSCFYKHAYPDGSLALLDAPKPRRRLYGARGPTASVANYILWNILTSTDEDDLSINDDIQSLYDLDEMYHMEPSDSDEEFITGWQ